MRQWTGVLDNAAPVGDGFQDLRNVSMRVKGEIRRRSTLSNRIATALTTLRIQGHDSLGGNQVSAPTAAPTCTLVAGGVGTSGTHTVRYRYYDSFLGVASTPSPETTVVLGGGNNQFTMTIVGDSLADSYILECTHASGSTFFKTSAATPTASFSFSFGPQSISINVSDATLTANAAYAGSVSTSSAAGSWMLHATSTSIVGVDLNAGTSFTCLSGLTNSTYYPTFGYMNQVTYVTNGVDSVKRIVRGDTAGTAAGIDAPNAAPGLGQGAAGSVTDGAHLVRYRYWDQLSNRYSNPSPSASITMAQSDAGTLTVTTTGTGQAGVERIMVEMTLADGTEFYQAGFAVNTAGSHPVVITMSDQTLAVQTPANVYAWPDGYGHDLPPVCRLSCMHRGRAFQWAPTSGSQRDLIYWSRIGLPESYKLLEWGRTGTLISGDSPAALLSFQDDLYLIGRRSMTRLIYTSDPADGILTPLPTNLGAFNQACVLSIDSDVYGFGRNGAWRIKGIMPKMVSDGVDEMWQAEIDFAQTNDCYISYDGNERIVRFHYSVSGSRGKKCACFHLETEQWTFDTFLNEAAHAAQAATSTGNTYLYVAEGMTYAGDLWQMRLDGKGDGYDATLSTGAFTAAVGSTTTVLQLSQATTASAFIGAYVYLPVSGESRRVTANTTTTITVGSAFSAAPAAGAEIYVGSADVYIEPFWSSLSGPEIGRNRPTYLILENVNDESAPELTVRFYADYSSTPLTLTNSGSDTPPQGVTIVNGTNYATVNLDDTQGGVAVVPVPSNWSRVIRYTISQRKPSGAIKLMDARWSATRDGVAPERSQA